MLTALLLVWTAAAGSVDVDGDGIADSIRIESRGAVRTSDPEPCASCGVLVQGHFEAVVSLSARKRTVRTPVALHSAGESWWFWDKPAVPLAIADYNADGRPDFNLGQYTNSGKWEYGLFTIGRNGRVKRLAPDRPEIYVTPGGEPSTARIEAIPGGMRFRDFGNAHMPGWWTFTCKWDRTRRAFDCVQSAESK